VCVLQSVREFVDGRVVSDVYTFIQDILSDGLERAQPVFRSIDEV
jgi:hypothetical protein